MDKIGLLATARTKAERPAKVIDFYKSPLFKQSVKYGLKTYDRLYFYNAKDGLLFPDQWMSPYDVSIKTFSTTQKRLWAQKVIETLMDYEQADCVQVYLHGGMVYRKFLEPELTLNGFHYEVPLQGYSIGKQLKWFKENLDNPI
ncbi:hypothetical protein JOD43_004014 [Pullulanibacillus pueri]|uniref:DUF6884 domain-containing protein n=1 Tax=Pullulanibacillus pueri TaxID=1437324 RepID=A0A8J3EP33_9BACL|nr:DUF6884 domain-containing protein [Pullulanibacillus pueri]MBM7683823.1 hypothetical protein [Pullulanibacillus pueri]GGH87769.1 hypothetical protein GCM10007096_38550 [Pullulanibacillus pueri]